jgi:hypothetical protein
MTVIKWIFKAWLFIFAIKIAWIGAALTLSALGLI